MATMDYSPVSDEDIQRAYQAKLRGIDPAPQFQESNSQPIDSLQSFRNTIYQEPQAADFAPGKGRRLLAAIAGGLAGIGNGNAGRGVQTAQEITGAPYRIAMSEYASNLSRAKNLSDFDQNQLAVAGERGLTAAKTSEQQAQKLAEDERAAEQRASRDRQLKEANALPGTFGEKHQADLELAKANHPEKDVPNKFLLHYDPESGTAITMNQETGEVNHEAISPGKAKEMQGELGELNNAHRIISGEVTGDKTAAQEFITKFNRKPEGSPTAGINALDRETARFAKPHEKNVSDAETRLSKIQEAKALINSPVIGQNLGTIALIPSLAGGQGSGVRVTQAELNSILANRGIKDTLQGYINSFTGKGKWTTQDLTQINGILDDISAKLAKKRDISSQALDEINGAGSREEAVAADKKNRKLLADEEKSQAQAGSTPQVTHRYNPQTKKIEEVK